MVTVGQPEEEGELRSLMAQPAHAAMMALELSNTGLWTWDIRTGEVTWTTACYRMFGVPPGTPLSLNTFIGSVVPEDLPALQRRIEQALADREEFCHRFRIRHADGHLVWLLNHGRAVYGEDGAPLAMMGCVRDVTADEQVQQQLRDSEERLSLAVEASGLGLWTWDVASDAVTWTEQCYVIHGMAPGSFGGTGEAFFALVHPEDRERVQRTVRTAVDRRHPYVCEFRICRPDGSIAWVTNRGRARYDEQGRPLSVIGTLGDVTELKQQQIALQAALTASNTGTFRWDMRTGVVQLDSRLERLFSLSEGHVLTTLDALIGAIHPDDRAKVRGRFLACEDAGGAIDVEFRIGHAEGTQRWLVARGDTYRDPHGMPAWMTGACVDITELKQAHEATQQALRALRRSEERFRAAVQAATDIVWFCDAEGRVVEPQPSWQRFTGQRQAQYHGDGWAGAVHPDDVAASVAAWQAAVGSQSKFVFEHRIRRHDGQWRTLAARALPVRDEAGHILEWVGAHTDITELRRAQATIERQNRHLQEADRRKDAFLAMLSHELRNPLAAIRTAAELLGRPGLDDAGLDRAKQILMRQTGHMSRLLDDMLNVVRIIQGKLQLRPQALTLEAVLQTAIEAAMPLIQGKGHRLRLPALPQAVELHGDHLRLAQVFSNLLSNAAKYTDPGGELQVRVQVQPLQVEVEVSDNGIGIAPQDLEHVFELFHQLPTDGDRADGGLGIGLALVRGLVRLHGGSVSAHSEGRGRGSRFIVRLPRQALPGGPPADSEDGTGGP